MNPTHGGASSSSKSEGNATLRDASPGDNVVNPRQNVSSGTSGLFTEQSESFGDSASFTNLEQNVSSGDSSRLARLEQNE